MLSWREDDRVITKGDLHDESDSYAIRGLPERCGGSGLSGHQPILADQTSRARWGPAARQAWAAMPVADISPSPVDEAGGLNTMRTIEAHPDIDVVLGTDTVVLGALAALRETPPSGLDSVAAADHRGASLYDDNAQPCPDRLARQLAVRDSVVWLRTDPIEP
jgi:hypothetical protein